MSQRNDGGEGGGRGMGFLNPITWIVDLFLLFVKLFF